MPPYTVTRYTGEVRPLETSLVAKNTVSDVYVIRSPGNSALLLSTKIEATDECRYHIEQAGDLLSRRKVTPEPPPICTRKQRRRLVNGRTDQNAQRKNDKHKTD
ncbi:hypothetical protein TGVAND_269425 [Toxoplasma gondii VAND]|uniref:Uncharacterized protein n=1 Tax=Toxoplasma gondii VAND TaxID=933077 RepID=A0A086Q0G1_TOXGO|nr:hypothetical protein TGVAND_269425 [Toxoplasma gondii VAND]